jgi:hypothetical protein
MKLPTPSAPFSPVYVHGESITIETEGKVLVLPTGNADVLPLFNEYTLNSNRLSIAESPFGGLKGSGSPDYAPGTVNIIEGDGVYLQDVNGQNSSKTLSAGKLKELNLMSVDTVNHAITEEFIVANTAESNNPTVIDNCDSVDGWRGAIGTSHVISVENGRLKVTGVSDTSGRLTISKSINADLSAYSFLCCTIQPHENGNCYVKIVTGAGNEHLYTRSRFPIVANSENRVVLPINSPQGSIGSMPYFAAGTFNPAGVTSIEFGVDVTSASTEITFYVDNITADTAKSATIEAQVPDNLSATSLSLYTHNGTAYQLCSTHSLDGAYSQISQTSANCTILDGTKLDDVYGTGAGRAVFPKGSAAATVNGSTGSLTYSENRGTDKRIGLKVDLPPSDNGRTNFNKVRAKLVINYAPDAENVYSATYIFADSTNTSYGLQNLSKPWIALYDPTSNLIDFYLFTHRPKNLEFRRDESGNIYELVLYPGNGLIYHGQITYPDLTLDSDSNLIPNFLEASIEGSITKFLQSYGMVI